MKIENFEKAKEIKEKIDALKEQLDELLNDEEREFHENEGLGSVSDLIGSIIYQADTIIEVLKDGKDKEVFEELVKDLRELEENRKNKKVTFKVLPQNGK